HRRAAPGVPPGLSRRGRIAHARPGLLRARIRRREDGLRRARDARGASQGTVTTGIRLAAPADFDAIFAIVNSAAQAYRGVIPADRWHEPYMDARELESEIAEGGTFWGYEDAGNTIG